MTVARKTYTTWQEVPRMPIMRLDYARTLFGLSDDIKTNAVLGSDAVLIALDIELRKTKLTWSSYQFGVACLDTRDLQHKRSEPLNIKTRQISSWGAHKHLTKQVKGFHFGSPESCVMKSDYDILCDLLRIDDERAPGTLRKIILVCFGASSEQEALMRFCIDFQEVAPILSFLDVTYMAREVITIRGLYSLDNVLRALGLPREGTHIAGNDANFTLRAMLLLLAVDQRPKLDQLSEQQRDMLASFEMTAFAPLPERVPWRRNGNSEQPFFDNEGYDLSDLDGISVESSEEN